MTASTRQLTLLLPDECTITTNNPSPKFITLAHPKTTLPTVFLHCGDKLYETTAIDGSSVASPNKSYHNEARSLLFDNGWIEGDASVLVCTPMNTLYFLLPALWRSKDRFFSIEDLHDSMEMHQVESTITIPYKLISSASPELVCDSLDQSGTAMYRLSIDKLVSYLDSLVAKITQTLPAQLVAKSVTSKLAPINMDIKTPENVTKLGLRRLGVGLVSSYLSPEVAKAWIDTLDFADLDLYIQNLESQRTAAKQTQELLNSQASRKRSLPDASGGAQKKTKTAAKKSASAPVKSNKSITSFFKKKQ